MKYIPAAAIILGLNLLNAHADVLKTTMGEEKGTFTEYKNSKFILRSDKGKDIEVPKATARELTLDEPVQISFKRKGKSQNESAQLLGYSKLQFQLKQKNKKTSLSAMYITSMRAQVPMSAGGSGAANVGGGEMAIPAVDTSEFDETVMTASQKSTLAGYRATRKRYDAFISQSAAMVTEMDRSSGARRDELLAKLRIRKNQEQPLRNEMSGAHRALLAAFPKGFPLKPKGGPVDGASEPVMPPPGKSAAEVIQESVNVEDGEVLLIDTSPLAKSGNLTDHQMNALDAYDKAAVAYEKITTKQAALARAVNSASDTDKANLMPIFEQCEQDAIAAKKKVLKTQKAFLKAFPQLQLTD